MENKNSVDEIIKVGGDRDYGRYLVRLFRKINPGEMKGVMEDGVIEDIYQGEIIKLIDNVYSYEIGDIVFVDKISKCIDPFISAGNFY